MCLSMLRPISKERLGLTAENRKKLLMSRKQGNRCRGQKYSPSKLWPLLASYPNQSFFLQVLTPSCSTVDRSKPALKRNPGCNLYAQAGTQPGSHHALTLTLRACVWTVWVKALVEKSKPCRKHDPQERGQRCKGCSVARQQMLVSKLRRAKVVQHRRDPAQGWL